MIEPIIPNRHDTALGRFYEHEGIMKPSATNIINVVAKDKYYEQWLADFGGYRMVQNYIKEAADRGTRTHVNAEALQAGMEVYTEGMPRDEVLMVLAFKEWVHTVKPKFLASEITMWHPDYPVAGTADIVCMIKDQLFLIDIKTGGNYDVHELQLTAYGRLYELVYRIKPQISVLKLSVSRGRPKYEAMRKGYADEALAHAIGLWNWKNPNKPAPPKPRIELPKIIKLDKEFINVEESEKPDDTTSENREN